MRLIPGAILTLAGAVVLVCGLLADVLGTPFGRNDVSGWPAYLSALLTSAIGFYLLAKGIFERSRPPQPPYGDRVHESGNSI
jgi:hypothetical protein